MEHRERAARAPALITGKLTHILLALALFGTALLVRKPLCTDELFVFDAADYIRAIQRGFWGQYSGSDSIPVSRFLRRFQDDAEFHRHPWGALYQENDAAALRHFHVPGGFYIPSWIDGSGGGPSAQKVGISILSALTIAMIYLILVHLGVSMWMALASALFLCFSPVSIVAGTLLSPHALFSLCAIGCMFAFCRWLETARNVWLAIFSVTFGVAVATLELSPLLFIAVLSTLVVRWWLASRTGQQLPLRKTLLGLAGSSLVAGLIWPGGWLRGGYLLSYGVFVFQGLFRSAIYFQQRSFTSSVYRLGQDWVVGVGLLALLAVAIYGSWLEARRERNVSDGRPLPLVGFSILAALLFAQGLGNGFRNTTYASHALFAIVMAAALAQEALRTRGRGIGRAVGMASGALIVILTAVGAVHVWRSWPQLAGPDAAEDPARVAGTIAELRKSFRPGTTFVVTEDPQAFITYARDFRFVGAASVTATAPEAWVKLDRYYLLFDTKAAKPPESVAFCAKGNLAGYGFLVSCETL